jgi:hypothetical protein
MIRANLVDILGAVRNWDFPGHLLLPGGRYRDVSRIFLQFFRVYYVIAL